VARCHGTGSGHSEVGPVAWRPARRGRWWRAVRAAAAQRLAGAPPMNPRAWAAWSAAALVVVLTSTNPIYRALVLLVAFNVLLARRRPDAALRPLLIAVSVAAIVAAVLNTLLSHTGAHIVFSVPDQVPGIGGPITAEAALYGVDVALGVAARGAARGRPGPRHAPP